MKLVNRFISIRVHDQCWDSIQNSVYKKQMADVLSIWTALNRSFQFPMRNAISDYLVEYKRIK